MLMGPRIFCLPPHNGRGQLSTLCNLHPCLVEPLEYDRSVDGELVELVLEAVDEVPHGVVVDGPEEERRTLAHVHLGNKTDFFLGR